MQFKKVIPSPWTRFFRLLISLFFVNDSDERTLRISVSLWATSSSRFSHKWTISRNEKNKLSPVQKNYNSITLWEFTETQNVENQTLVTHLIFDWWLLWVNKQK